MSPALDDHEARLRVLEAALVLAGRDIDDLQRLWREWEPVFEHVKQDLRDREREGKRRSLEVARWQAILGAAWISLTPLLTAVIVHYLGK